MMLKPIQGVGTECQNKRGELDMVLGSSCVG